VGRRARIATAPTRSPRVDRQAIFPPVFKSAADIRRRSNELGRGIDPRVSVTDLSIMTRSITIEARWDGEANVWIATSNDVPGLVVEADTWPMMIEEVRLILPELLELAGERADNLSLTFRAEEHLDVAGA
jgi:hypothetical protein